MEYQKIKTLLGKTPYCPFKFRTRNWVKVNDDMRTTYRTNSQVIFKTTMLKKQQIEKINK